MVKVEVIQIFLNLVQLSVEVVHKMLILLLGLLESNRHERAHILQARDRVQSVENHGSEEDHAKHVAPHIDGLVVHLEKGTEDCTNGFVVANAIATADKLVIDKVHRSFGRATDESPEEFTGLLHDITNRLKG